VKRPAQAIVLAERASKRVSGIIMEDRSETPFETGVAPVNG